MHVSLTKFPARAPLAPERVTYWWTVTDRGGGVVTRVQAEDYEGAGRRQSGSGRPRGGSAPGRTAVLARSVRRAAAAGHHPGVRSEHGELRARLDRSRGVSRLFFPR